ncbi:DJ-1/PfpI family protein, partial [Pseudomonas aeruginosa]|nr:DJ-1/PfpI family protein [Pseudomonas aeruginosa]
IRSRKVAILIADGVAESDVSDLRDALRQEGADAKLIAPSASPVQAENGAELIPEGTWDGLPSVAFDAVFVPGGAASSQAIGADGRGLHYLLEAYKHLKPVAFAGDAQA